MGKDETIRTLAAIVAMYLHDHGWAEARRRGAFHAVCHCNACSAARELGLDADDADSCCLHPDDITEGWAVDFPAGNAAAVRALVAGMAHELNGEDR